MSEYRMARPKRLKFKQNLSDEGYYMVYYRGYGWRAGAPDDYGRIGMFFKTRDEAIAACQSHFDAEWAKMTEVQP